MKQNGVFNKVKGIWIGNYTHESGITLEQILLDTLENEFKRSNYKIRELWTYRTKDCYTNRRYGKIDTSENTKIKLLENCVK